MFTMYTNEIFIEGSKGAGIVVSKNVWEKVMKYKDRLPDTDSWHVKSYEIGNNICDELSDKMMFGPNSPAICKAYWSYHKH